MTRTFLILACLSGMLAVILGAFGAHALKEILSEYQLRIFETGVRYHFYHTFALFLTALLVRYLSKRWTKIAGWLFLSGIVCFSGSLYMLAVADALEVGQLKAILGPLTPIGGVLFVCGWIALCRASADYRSPRHNEN
jgi:uncharacterized membrane protein YgdD (TMEM256/DUF423 family)